jgi:hypothetical protein
MRSISVVVAHPTTDPILASLPVSNALRNTHSYFSDRHSRSMKTLSIQRPRPSIEMRMPASRSVLVPLLVAELVARGLDGFVQNSFDVPRIVRRVQLPGVGGTVRPSIRAVWTRLPPHAVLERRGAVARRRPADLLPAIVVQSARLLRLGARGASIEGGRSNALLTLVDPFTSQHRKLIVEFAARRRLPAIYEAREFVESGGLISYGPNLVAIERRAAEYVDRILKGAKPADLPVEQPTKIEMLINMKTAKTLGLDNSPVRLAARRRGGRINDCDVALAHSRFWHIAAQSQCGGMFAAAKADFGSSSRRVREGSA